jgi:hypothetical protein
MPKMPPAAEEETTAKARQREIDKRMQSERRRQRDHVSKKGGKAAYRRVNQDEVDMDHSEGMPVKITGCRRACVPIFVLITAGLVLTSQFELAFETRYRYDYQVENVAENGDGKTYAYNIWKGVYQVIIYAAFRHGINKDARAERFEIEVVYLQKIEPSELTVNR